MPRQRRSYPVRRVTLRLPEDLVRFFEGTVMIRPEEMRVGYGLNEIVRECLEERKARMIAHAAAAAASAPEASA